MLVERIDFDKFFNLTFGEPAAADAQSCLLTSAERRATTSVVHV